MRGTTSQSQSARKSSNAYRRLLRGSSARLRASERKTGTGLQAAPFGDTFGDTSAPERADEKTRAPVSPDKKKRRARDSNPQPVARHLISSEAASQFAYPPDRFGIVAYPAAAGERHSEAHCDLCARIGKVKHYSSLIASILRTPQEFV